MGCLIFLDHPIPSPQTDLPSDKTLSVANLLAKATGLWNSISITAVPNAILLVFAATWASVSYGSNII